MLALMNTVLENSKFFSVLIVYCASDMSVIGVCVCVCEKESEAERHREIPCAPKCSETKGKYS